MAIRFARRVRPLLAIAALGATLVAAPTLASAAPGAPHAKPTINSVQKRLGELAMKNDQLVEKYNQAQVSVHRRDKAAEAAQREATAATAVYTHAHDQFTEVIQQQYENGSFGAAGALLDSNSGSNYLDRLDTLDMVSTHTAQVVSAVTKTREEAAAASTKAHALLAAARSERDKLASRRTAVSHRIHRYKKLLATLTAEQRAAYEAAANPTVSSSNSPSAPAQTHLTANGSGAARRAVQFALDQVGKPYVFGAAGPDSYDCSGLTMAAWQQGGVSLPHSAADQYNYGQHVSRDALQPGDLIFFYQPIGHVTIYVGDGMMVSAPTEGENVSVVPLSEFNSDYVGATRLT